MAQENNVSIPDQISWTKDTKEQTYRGTTVQSRSLNNDAINFGAKPFGKNAINISNDISGGPIEINFGGNNISPMNNKIKQSEPIIQIINNNNNNENNEYKQNNNNIAPLYDGFQPHYAHYSKTMNPIKMQQTIKSILLDLEQNGVIDFYEKSTFVYTGRAYGEYNDCEFLLSIFSDESSECIIEIRRSCGESFEYANIENSILKELLSLGAISSEYNNNEEEEEEEEIGFGFGFGSLPSLDTMELDSNYSATSTSDNDLFEDDNKCFQQTEININKAKQLLENAVDLQSMRDVLRSDIAHLNEIMSKNENIFKTIPEIINILINAINDDFYDCWGIKMYLGMISKLISCSTPIPSSLFNSITNIQTKWSHMVINQVAPGVKFEFYPSQQIVRCCNQIIKQIK